MKGVIIAAGYGTRFLPITKTIPKEMLPIVDRPAIDFVVNEFIDAGIKDIIIITSRRKKQLEDYFDREIELETIFTKENKTDKLEKIRTYKDTNFIFIRQQTMLGTGHAMLLLKDIISCPFIVAYPDDLFLNGNVSKDLIDNYNKYKKSVIALEQMTGDVSAYGVVETIESNESGIYNVKSIVEKPEKGKEPSKLVSIGRYLYTPDVFKYLMQGWENHSGGEYYHVHALNKLGQDNLLLGSVINCRRYDTGTPLKYLDTVIDYALSRKDIKNNFLKILRKKLDNY